MPINDAVLALTLVEDDPPLRDVLTRAARSWRYECQTAASAEQAVQLLEKRRTPVVVTDLHMPGVGGVWLVRQIRQRWPDIAIIVITASQEIESAIECLNAGATRYFLKPIHLDEFRHALEATLHSFQLRRERQRYQRKLERAVRRQTQRVRSTFLSAIDSLVRTLEARDPYTSGHSLRVRRYALRLAGVLGLDRRQRKQLSLAAKLHDIGKVGLPEAILNKPADLTAEEYRRVQEHPVIGERILAPIIHSAAVLAAIRSHHERLDGGGYPDGLAGEQIPVLARVITVVDCFDALTSSRAYRSYLSVGQALEVLRAGSGTQFDPAFVQAFIERVAPKLSGVYPVIRS
jgi:putative two-component system response regulator